MSEPLPSTSVPNSTPTASRSAVVWTATLAVGKRVAHFVWRTSKILIKNPHFLLFCVGVLLVSQVFTVIYLGNAYRQLHDLKTGQAPASQTQNGQTQTSPYLAEISQFINLPDETPTIATVSDREKVKDQPFFRQAENGDILLVFAQAQKAVLYRPSTHKIIEVGPIQTGTSSQ